MYTFNPTPRQQYDAGYPDNRIDMEEGNLQVWHCASLSHAPRHYGYTLYNTRLRKAFGWYKTKALALDALTRRQQPNYWSN